MNARGLSYQRNDIFRLLKRGAKRNACLYSSCNTDEHEDMKWRTFRQLRKMGHHVVTEATFEGDQGRADVLDLDTGTVFEVLHSESVPSAIGKVKKYPGCLKVVLLTTSGRTIKVER